MQMGVVEKSLSPGVEHREESDLRAQMLGVGRNGAQRLPGSPEQNAVDDLLILGLLQIEWVKWGGFSRVDGDFKGFLVNLTVTSWRHVCPHAKIDQDEAPER
jgi:hypothetical protein